MDQSQFQPTRIYIDFELRLKFFPESKIFKSSQTQFGTETINIIKIHRCLKFIILLMIKETPFEKIGYNGLTNVTFSKIFFKIVF